MDGTTLFIRAQEKKTRSRY